MKTSTRWIIVCFVILITGCLIGGMHLDLISVIPKKWASDIGTIGVFVAIVFAWPSS
jgi:hypothetical protein